MNKPNIAFLVTGNGTVILTANFKTYHVNTDHENYQKIREAINDHCNGKYISSEDWVTLVDLTRPVLEYTGSAVVFENGEFMYGGKPMHNAMVDKIKELRKQNFDAKPMINFLGNAIKNPSMKTLEAVFPFVCRRYMPITEDGCFFAYKSVRPDYTDWNTGTIDNRVGAKIERLERNLVDDDANLVCSFGYHVGDYDYAYGFKANPGRHIMMVKVNPADVVSVPNDAYAGKVRVTFYEIVSEMTDITAPIKEAVVNNVGGTYNGPLDNEDLDDDDDWDDDLMDEESDSYDSYGESDSYDEDSYEEEEVTPSTSIPWPASSGRFTYNNINYDVGGSGQYLYRPTQNGMHYAYLSVSGNWEEDCRHGCFSSYEDLKRMFENTLNVKDSVYRPRTNENYKKQKRDSNGRFIKS